ncbi:1-acyl-sn-glycerol-3-phosphate acyltransferase [Parelusimicrobium proximum]|uniref:lysophospholipid acyltransferase family protein n=1 Tax=Parelusimicrobium proximum TaxID=3228953 RepID=UPI003D164704
MLKKICLFILTVFGFFLFGLFGVLLYPYFWITGFKEGEVRYFFFVVSRSVFWVVKAASNSFEVVKKADIPPGPAVITPNHSSILDILCMSEFGMKDIVFAAKGWPFKVPFMGKYLSASGGIRTDNMESFAAFKAEAEKRFCKGLKIIIFPEGTRSKDGSVGRFRSGAFALAIDCGVPVIPVALKGLDKAIPKNGFWVSASDVRLTMLAPVSNYEKYGNNALKMAKYVKELIVKELEE